MAHALAAPIRTLAVLALAVPFALGARAPSAQGELEKLVPAGTVVYAKAPSLDRLVAMANEIRAAVAPETPAIELDMLLGELDLPGSLDLVDRSRPIAMCLVLPESESEAPVPAFVVPTTSGEAYARSITDESPDATAHVAGGYVLASPTTGLQPATAAPAITAGFPSADAALRIDAGTLIERFRPMIDMGLDAMEMQMSQMAPDAPAGFDVAVVMETYVDFFRAVLDSADTFDLALSVVSGRVEMHERLAVFEGSPLAGWSSADDTAAAELARSLDPDAMMSIVLGWDAPAWTKRLRPVLEDFVEAYPDPIADMLATWLESADELAVAMGNAFAMSADFGPDGLRGAYYLRPSDPAALVTRYDSMLRDLPGVTVESGPASEIDGTPVTRMRIHVDASAMTEAAAGASTPEAAQLQQIVDTIYGAEGISLAFATRGETMTIVLGGDDAYLRSALARAGREGAPPPQLAAGLARVGELNPCYVLSYDIGRLMHGAQAIAALLGPEVPAPEAFPASFTVRAWAGSDGSAWLGGASVDLAALAEVAKTQGADAPVTGEDEDR